MKSALFVSLILLTTFIHAQDTIFWNSNGLEVNNLALAETYLVKEKVKEPNVKSILRTYSKEGKLIRERFYEDRNLKKATGIHKSWREDGSIKFSITYKKDERNGELKSFWPDGTIKRKDIYRNGKLISGNVFNEEGERVTYYEFEERPEFPGGPTGLKKYISENFKYPTGSATKGKIIVKFIVNKDGTVLFTEIKQGLTPVTNAAAIELIKKMPAWTPGYVDGEPVNVPLSLPLVIQ